VYKRQVETKTIVDDSQTQLWKVIAAAALILWLLTLLAYFKKNNPPAAHRQRRTVQPVDKLQSQSSKHKNLVQAIKLNQIDKIETSILEWTSSLVTTPIHSLGHLISQIKDSQLIEKLNQLQSQRYSASKTDFHCEISKSDLETIVSELTRQKDKRQERQIPALYAR